MFDHGAMPAPRRLDHAGGPPSDTGSMIRSPVQGEERMSVKRVDDVSAEPVSVGKGTTRQVLIGPDEAPHFAMRRFVIEPGGGMPAHTNTVEHEQYVLAGRATIGIGNETREVRRGDIVYIAAGTPHWYQAHDGEAFEFLCVVPNLPDTIALVPGQ
jgi:quercetin dioxygenase-like cupin family protein